MTRASQIILHIHQTIITEFPSVRGVSLIYRPSHGNSVLLSEFLKRSDREHSITKIIMNNENAKELEMYISLNDDLAKINYYARIILGKPVRTVQFYNLQPFLPLGLLPSKRSAIFHARTSVHYTRQSCRAIFKPSS